MNALENMASNIQNKLSKAKQDLKHELHETVQTLESKTTDNFKKAEIDREALHSSIRVLSVKAEKVQAAFSKSEIANRTFVNKRS